MLIIEIIKTIILVSCSISGLDLRLRHDSVIWEDAANVEHATTEVLKSTQSIARISIVGYKHEHLFFAHHGYHEQPRGEPTM